MENLSSATNIEDLADELLIEIFIRLPCCETVITAKIVSKRWLCLLSNPKFAIEFYNHKKNFPFPSKKLPWTFLSTQLTKNIEGMIRTNSPFHKVFNSPKFSLIFLPFQVKLVATFKDLILCTDSSSDDYRQYYICNPVTKQWVALPLIPTRGSPTSWVGLVCEEPYYNDIERRIDYKFRVIVIMRLNLEFDPYYMSMNLIVFCSEDCNWKDIVLRVRRTPSRLHSAKPLKGVVCKGMVCVRYRDSFGMFDPFDVTPNSSRVIEAKTLPMLLYLSGNLLECGGKLISIYLVRFVKRHTRVYHKGSYVDVKGDCIIMQYSVLDLNGFIGNNSNNEVRWETYKKVSFNQVKSPSTRQSEAHVIYIHPTNAQMIYVLTNDNKVYLCNIGGSACLEKLGEILPGVQGHHQQFYCSSRLELQYWPTPVPLINPNTS